MADQKVRKEGELDSPVQAGLPSFIRLIARTLRLKSTNENKYRYDRCIGIESLSFGRIL